MLDAKITSAEASLEHKSLLFGSSMRAEEEYLLPLGPQTQIIRSNLLWLCLFYLRMLRVISRAGKHSQGTFLVPLFPSSSGKQFITRQEREGRRGKTDGGERLRTLLRARAL